MLSTDQLIEIHPHTNFSPIDFLNLAWDVDHLLNLDDLNAFFIDIPANTTAEEVDEGDTDRTIQFISVDEDIVRVDQ